MRRRDLCEILGADQPVQLRLIVLRLPWRGDGLGGRRRGRRRIAAGLDGAFEVFRGQALLYYAGRVDLVVRARRVGAGVLEDDFAMSATQL